MTKLARFSSSTSRAIPFAQLRDVASRLPGAAAFLVDSSLNYVWAVGEGLAAAGLEEQDFIGKSVRAVLPPESMEEGVAAYADGFQGRTSTREHFSHGRYYSTRVVPVPGEGGTVQAVLAMSFDISERKAIEDRATYADQGKDRLLLTLAHELRTPLATMQTLVEILRLEKDGSLATRSLPDVLQRQVTHMSRLVEDLLDASATPERKLRIDKTLVSLDEVLDSAIELARAGVDRKKHRLRLDVDQATKQARLFADPGRLAQVFSNLLVNAAKFTAPHGEIGIMARTQGQRVSVSVVDNGVGIAPEIRSRIFEPFFQVDSGHGGLGLGLALVRSIAELHGGTVEARSEGEGMGSEFLVSLPLFRDA